MTGFLDRLQLRPQERRLVVMGGLVIFVLLNLWFVWPHYGDYARFNNQRRTAANRLADYRQETGRTNDYVARLRQLEQEGSGFVEANSDLMVQNTLASLAQSHGLSLPINKVAATTRGRTNEYFEQITFSANIPPTVPEPLLKLLTSIASNAVVMRVKELDLKPMDVTRTRLGGNMRVVASFQKKSLIKPTAAATSSKSAP